MMKKAPKKKLEQATEWELENRAEVSIDVQAKWGKVYLFGDFV